MEKSTVLKGLATALIAAIAAFAIYLAPAMVEPEDAGIGIMVGETAPIETPMRDAMGEPTSLAAIAGPKGTVLVMTRSVDWCPFCAAQLKDQTEIAEQITDLGFTFASLSYDEPMILSNFQQDHGIPHVMLSDTESKFVSKTGLWDMRYAEDDKAYGVPYPTIMVLNAEGEVLNKLVSEDYRQRPSNETILKLVDKVAG